MKRFGLSTFVVSLFLAAGVRADVKVPSVIGSHMVLQRDKPLPIWGTADPGEEVTVQFGDKSEKATADQQGKWKVTLPAMKADDVTKAPKGQTMTISGKNKIELTDILIGEVWIGSGQSNMEFSVAGSHDAKESIPAADHPTIRLFQVPKVQAAKPADNVNASWEVCSPKTVGRFSGVLYYFGQRLNKELNVPIGLLHSSWGGSPIEPWTIDEKGSGGMYNGMIAPLVPFAVRGATWYQGESNMGDGMKYRDKMEALIKGWRGKFGKDLSFYFVQIAPYTGYGPGSLPILWEAQTAVLKVPKTGMAVITDLVPNLRDIHPTNKKDVGNRLALWALTKDYGKKDLVYSGPLYKSMQAEANKVRINFAHVGGGLKSRDGKPLSEFEIAGADGKFVAAEAMIDGDAVVVSAKEVATPTQVRFGWRNIANPNLVNKEGLPASAFQTKNWQGGTGE